MHVWREQSACACFGNESAEYARGAFATILFGNNHTSSSRYPHTEGVVASETQIHARTEHTNEALITRLYNERNRSPPPLAA